MKIVAWSGPRNLSTAMMYSFGNRTDCAASDEPFYGAFLEKTGIVHPMRDEVLASMERDPAVIAETLRGPNPGGTSHWYQKHMCHHMVEGIPLDWAEGMGNIHLIRHPARVIASYVQKRENPTLDDIGFARQTEIFDALPGPVVDSWRVRRDPKGMMQKLCAEIGLPWDAAMLRWPSGPRAFDGVWGRHWYDAVHASTGFAGVEGPPPEVEHPALTEALEHYQRLLRFAL